VGSVRSRTPSHQTDGLFSVKATHIIEEKGNTIIQGKSRTYHCSFSKEIQNDEGEVVCVVIRKPQLVSDCVQKKVPPLCIQVCYKVSEKISGCFNLKNIHLTMADLLGCGRCICLVQLQLLHRLVFILKLKVRIALNNKKKKMQNSSKTQA
jgi:hypothetical protein